jgi:integrase
VAHVGAVHEPNVPALIVMTDGTGAVVVPVADYLHSLAAGGAGRATLRSYALALLRWWRFLAAVDVRWDEATGVEVRDFVLWMRCVPKRRTGSETTPPPGGSRVVTTGQGYAPATINHNLAVLSSFYAPDVAAVGAERNPVPPWTGPGGEAPHAHHNPMRPFQSHRRAPLRQKVPKARPRGLPDREFDALFVAMRSDRDRALLAFYVSTGARASELLTVTEDRVDVGRQVIGVHRKGSGRLQWLPASADAFVWLRLYQQHQPRPAGERSLWLTLRPPHRPLTYTAMRRVLQRANGGLGTGWTLHDLRHTAARRMIADSAMSLIDVQWVLGHANLTTTQIYLEPGEDDVVARVLAYHAQRAGANQGRELPPTGAYSPEVLPSMTSGTRRRPSSRSWPSTR